VVIKTWKNNHVLVLTTCQNLGLSSPAGQSIGHVPGSRIMPRISFRNRLFSIPNCEK
jgi:hypothetical protein